MRTNLVWVFVLFLLSLRFAQGQGTVPTFTHTVGQSSYTLVGRDPIQGVTTTIPTVLVPVTLSFDAKKVAGKPFVMDVGVDVPQILRSPVFSRFAFVPGNTTQYADAMLRTTFPKAEGWHTLLGKPEVKPVTITVPVGYGYVLTSKKSGRSFAVVDVEFLQKELFKQFPRQDGRLVVAVTQNTTYYSDGDATECCSWGTHGVDSATGNSFVLGSYLRAAPAVVEDSDVQPLTQQLAEFINDPLHDPLFHGGRNVTAPGNSFPAWMRLANVSSGDQGRCGGTGIASAYFLLEPTNTNPKNNIPASKAFIARAGGAVYHLQNAALLPWYTGASGGLGGTYSFPDAQTLTEAAKPCPARDGPLSASVPAGPTVAAIPLSGSPNGHQLIGYWAGYSRTGPSVRLRDVSPQWDVVIVAFSTPDKNGPEGTMQFHTPVGVDTAEFKGDIAYLKSQGKKVMISLGGGGEHFTLADPNRVPNYVSSVTRIVSDYGFDGIDIDFESPSLSIDPGDTDFRRPTTPSIVNLISALHQLHDHFGPGFMISLVPEGTQIPSGYPSYGGQFGSYLAITYAIRDILSFIDVQDYNTPPLEGLDGEIYQPGTVDYHAAMTELLLHGFNVGGDAGLFFPPMPPDNYSFSNVVGPQLHSYPATK
jgi:chitinase